MTRKNTRVHHVQPTSGNFSQCLICGLHYESAARWRVSKDVTAVYVPALRRYLWRTVRPGVALGIDLAPCEPGSPA